MKRIIIGIGFLFFLGSFCACDKQSEKITVTHTGMGTVVQETLYVKTQEQGETVLLEIQRQLDELEKNDLSWREDTSQVALINKQAGNTTGTRVTGEVYEYLTRIIDISAQCKGALDITLGSVTKLWDLDTWATVGTEEQRSFSVPKEESLQAALKDTGYERICLQEGYVILPEGMGLDLGAVGKGIACDRIGACLKKHEEITGAVISVGGSILTYGTKPDEGAWNVAIVHPRREGACLGTISLKGEWYISTSGDYERYVEKDGIRYHHIIDPANGYPANSGLCSVTIVSESGLVSDALSTACFVLGAEKGQKLAEEFGAEALFVTSNQELIMTDGMQKLFREAN